MSDDLSILSWGVVSPGGTGVDSLSNPTDWPKTLVPENAHPDRAHPVAYVAPETLPDRWRLRPRFRRASPISHFMVEAASQALEAQPGIDRSRLGMIYATSVGCSLYSVRFYRQFQKEGRRFASPLLFPETVTNSPLSHLASEFNTGGPVYSQIGDKSCWSNALRTASCWLKNGDADSVLVIGAEEFEPHELDAFRAMRWLDRPYTRPFAEGAGALLLARGAHPNTPKLTQIADGFCFHSLSAGVETAQRCLGKFPPEIPVCDSATGWIETVAQKTRVPDSAFGPLPNLAHEAYCASCSWDTIRAAAYLSTHPSEALVVPYWGLSLQVGAALLSGAAF